MLNKLFEKRIWIFRELVLFLVLIVCAGQIFFPISTQECRAENGFFQRHPKARKFLKIAGIGAVTGGIGGLVLGGGVASHALVGAGVHTGIAAARDKKTAKKSSHGTHQEP